MKPLEAGNTCPRCGQAFHCGAGDTRCVCFELRLSESLRQALAQQYECCLCVGCLKDEMVRLGAQSDA